MQKLCWVVCCALTYNGQDHSAVVCFRALQGSFWAERSLAGSHLSPAATLQHPLLFVQACSCYRDGRQSWAVAAGALGGRERGCSFLLGMCKKRAEHEANAECRSLTLLLGGLTGLLLLLSEGTAIPNAVLRSRATGFPVCVCKSHPFLVWASKSDISREQAPSFQQWIN